MPQAAKTLPKQPDKLLKVFEKPSTLHAPKSEDNTMSHTHALTDEQKEKWKIDGYLHLPNILQKNDVKTLRTHLDQLHRKHVLNNPEANKGRGLDRRNLLPDNDVFIHLIDRASIFDIVLDLMGPYIQLSMAQGLVRPPNPSFEGYIHTDGGPALRNIRVTETSLPLQIKIQYFLTDVTQPNSGNFTLFPGSHLRPFPSGDNPITVNTPGAVQLVAKAGDAAVFAHSLWHGVSPNRSKRHRKSLIYCYSQMCFRPFDFYDQPPHILNRCTPRQRRLLGELPSPSRPASYFYSPKDQTDVMAKPE
jgi:ectoine hydroxylase-related dioxygenase (phytanoyl-CoA dioxygenase family)